MVKASIVYTIMCMYYDSRVVYRVMCCSAALSGWSCTGSIPASGDVVSSNTARGRGLDPELPHPLIGHARQC